jgi:hypothetical protein
MAASERDRDKLVLVRDVGAGVAVAATVFFLSYANGGFEPTTRAYAAIAAWWVIGVGAAIGLGSARARLSRAAIGVPFLFALFAVWTLISMAWAPDAERAFVQFDEVSLYVAALVLAIVVARFVPAAFLAGGIALALSAIATVALVSRLFPSTFGVALPTGSHDAFAVRLSFPIGYWNGLGIEVALAVPLLLAAMTSRSSRLVRALAVVPFPILAADMYLASSRGAFVVAGLGAVVFLLLAPNRWPALVAAAFAGLGGAVGVAELVHKHELISGGAVRVAVAQGHRAALLIALTCVTAAVVWLAVCEAGRRLKPPPPVVGWVTAGVLVVLAIAAIALSHPIRHFDDFRNANIAGLTRDHLLSSSGSGRWQFWGAAVSEFRAHPAGGGGAGSFEFWWNEHGSLPVFTEFAHSLYLETMAELGIIGLLLLLGWLLLGVVGAVRAARALASTHVAAVAATAIAFFVAAAYDWVWPLAGIALVGVGCLGIALAALPSGRAAEWGSFGFVRPLLALLAVAAIIPQVVVLSAGIHLRDSQNAAAAGDSSQARSQALAAKAVEPWAAGPYVQLGRLAQDEGRYAEARHWLGLAIDRSRQDWALWLIASQIDTQRGQIRAARSELAEARTLNPRSSLFRPSH